jgi:acetylornithine deacetylase
MHVFDLTRELIDIPSVTNEEEKVGLYLYEYLSRLAAMHEGNVEKIEVEPRRSNVFASFGKPLVTLSTHMDTVPPWFGSRVDDEFIWGRGACDTKGIIASMIKAAEALLEAGVRDFGLLFVVGEERNSAGAYHAAKDPRGSKYIINGEPTSNQLALGSKGGLRYEVVATGKMAHSAYPELGDSAVHKLVQALDRVLDLQLPNVEGVGPSTLNIGVVEGGRAPNVIADAAAAQVLVRLVGPSDETRTAIEQAVAGLAEVEFTLEIPFIRMRAIAGLETMVAAFTTDIPALTNWGEPLLLGPGSIHVAHTPFEKIAKQELLEAVDLYYKVARGLVG